MNNTSKVLIGVLAIIAILSMSTCGTYNNLVNLDENVNGAWSQVENQYQRRLELIPNLVETVKQYTAYERETFEAVTLARAEATKTEIKVDPSNMNAKSLQQFYQAQDGLTAALGKLMVVMEKYPELKANEQFLSLQAEIAGTENRIAVERQNFIKSVKSYNKSIRRFPNVVVAGMFGFDKITYFESDLGASEAPSVKEAFNE